MVAPLRRAELAVPSETSFSTKATGARAKRHRLGAMNAATLSVSGLALDPTVVHFRIDL